MRKLSCVIICRCSAKLVSADVFDLIMNGLISYDVDIHELDDLCAISLNEKNILKDIAANYRQKIVIACFPRAVKSILEQGEIDLGDFRVLNFRELSAEQILSVIRTDFNIPAGNPYHYVHTSGLSVPAWYPVVDSSRCSLCGKCAGFCLFGVYKFDKKSLRVVNPLSCKNNCPACGRICTESAIIFPRWPETSVLSGAEPGNETKAEDQEKLIYQLKERNRKRKIIFREGFINKVKEDHLKAIESLNKGSENNE